MKRYTVEETAKMLGVSRPTIYRWLKAGKIGSLKMGGLRFITDKHIKEFLESCEE